MLRNMENENVKENVKVHGERSNLKIRIRFQGGFSQKMRNSTNDEETKRQGQRQGCEMMVLGLQQLGHRGSRVSQK